MPVNGNTELATTAFPFPQRAEQKLLVALGLHNGQSDSNNNTSYESPDTKAFVGEKKQFDLSRNFISVVPDY